MCGDYIGTVLVPYSDCVGNASGNNCSCDLHTEVRRAAVITSLGSASSLRCERDTARICCRAPVDRWDRQTDIQTDVRPFHRDPAPHTTRSVPTHNYIISWRRGVVVSGVRRMNEVNARRARLVPGWVTVFGRVFQLGM